MINICDICERKQGYSGTCPWKEQEKEKVEEIGCPDFEVEHTCDYCVHNCDDKFRNDCCEDCGDDAKNFEVNYAGNDSRILFGVCRMRNMLDFFAEAGIGLCEAAQELKFCLFYDEGKDKNKEELKKAFIEKWNEIVMLGYTIDIIFDYDYMDKRRKELIEEYLGINSGGLEDNDLEQVEGKSENH